MLEFAGLFIFISGFIIGLGAVVVIDIHGLLGRNSGYWTETTIRVHKVTKPMIWAGMFLAISGGVIFYTQNSVNWITTVHSALAPILVMNGVFLSFYVSPLLLEREKSNRSRELLPRKLQRQISMSFIVSFIGWWGSFGLLIYYILHYA